MTEQEWMDCTDLEKMLGVPEGKTSDRKLRLFAVACCRRVWHLIRAEYHRRTVEVAERFADGLATREELVDSYQVGENRPGSLDEGDFDPRAEGDDFDPFCVPWPSSATCACAACSGSNAAEETPYWCAALAAWTRPKTIMEDERVAQADLLRDNCGNPFRSVAIDPAWLSWSNGTVPKLVQVIYDDRRFSDLPILADALEEAGCSNPDILAHCRSEGPHVRGCWVVDLILGKS
jgi:hypothetical protein